MEDWLFTDLDGAKSRLNLPHSWNALDGQDGGDDYRRGTCRYEKVLAKPITDLSDLTPDVVWALKEKDKINYLMDERRL